MNRREKVVTTSLYSLFALSLLLLGFGSQEPGVEKIGQTVTFEVLGFYTGPEPGLPSSEDSMTNNSDDITYIAPFFYMIKADGSKIEMWNDTNSELIQDTLKLAHTKNIRVLALIHNLLYGSSETARQAAHKVLSTDADRRRFVGQVLQLVKSSGYDGVNLDIEYLYPEDGGNFSLFLKELKAAFAKENLLVTVCVPAKTRDSYPGQWGEHFDYKEIGKWADRVIVMSYDEHGFSSGPGPIASTDWLENVINYSVRNIPREKILLGVPAYGFDWSENDKKPRYLSFQTASKTARTENVLPVFDQTAKVPHFIYQSDDKTHQVWYEDALSSKYKIDLAKKNDLKGIAIWRLGMEDPALWEYVGSDETTEKPE